MVMVACHFQVWFIIPFLIFSSCRSIHTDTFSFSTSIAVLSHILTLSKKREEKHFLPDLMP